MPEESPEESPIDPEIERAKKYKSIFESAPGPSKDIQPRFFQPDAFGLHLAGEEVDSSEISLRGMSAWDVATRYHEFRNRGSFRHLAKQLRRMSASAILEKAQEVLGAVVHSVDQHVLPWPELPHRAENIDLDLEETIENAPASIAALFDQTCHEIPLSGHDLWMSYQLPRTQPIVLSVDTSLSMTGEKLSLTAVALAVVLLEFPEDPIGIVAFENEAKVLKAPSEQISVALLVERFLDVPAQGYTHLEAGMKGALQLVRSATEAGQGKPASTVLLTDGKYTAGKDPAYLASRFPHLVVLKMGKERSSLGLCEELAKKGRGVIREIDDLGSLPVIMYGVVKDLLRGRSIT